MQFTGIFAALALAASLIQAAPLSRDVAADKKAAGLRLIELGEGVEPIWMSEDEKLELIMKDTRFIDVTNTYGREKKAFAKAPAAYASPSHQAAVKPIISTLSIDNMKSTLTALTTFNNRYYKSQTGLQASNYIRDTIQGYITQNKCNATVALFDHTWLQKSIIAKIPGTSNGPVTILGAHMDSVNGASPTTGRSPGADDNGTGTVNLIEAFRALAKAGFAPKYPVEFHWYSGEEGGLLGSGDISSTYSDEGVQVKAMMQLDMTGYTPPNQAEVVALIPDNVSADLNVYLGKLIDAYLSIPWVTSPKCGYGCSDHASWYKEGYPSSLPFETKYGQHNSRIHTANDTVNVTGFSWTHTLEYAKLAVAFAYELGTSA